MAWWTFGLSRSPRTSLAVVQSDIKVAQQRALTAAITPVPRPQTQLLRTSGSWQKEVWDYYDSSGEFHFAMDWKAAMLSRVRLYAAEMLPGEDEPSRLDSGSAVDLMTMFGGGVSGQAQLMSSLTTQLDVPGEGYIVGETVQGSEQWSVRSVEEIRANHGIYEVIDEHAVNSDVWRPVQNGHAFRVWRPHKRWYHVADSPARSARGALRELELVDRHITAQYLSRLASAGVVLFPDEITFPVREEFADAEDPFMAEWIEIAATAIRKPGTASAVVPIPLRVPGEWLDKIKFLDFTPQIDEKIIDKRDSAIKKLATRLNVPAEILLGVGDLNHWGMWFLDESALKTVIAPDAELICQALTSSYLQPRLVASGEKDIGRIVVWYDLSELALRPDKSDNAIQAYDRLEISGAALRRETGFDESDEPTSSELTDQALKLILRTIPTGSLTALQKLTGESLDTPVPSEEPQPVQEPAQPPAKSAQAPPNTESSPAPEESLADQRLKRLVEQSRSPHAIRFILGGRWEVLHPAVCEKYAYSCPYTQAALKLGTTAHPGRFGLYECSIDSGGQLLIGDFSPHKNTDELLITGSEL